MTSLSLPQSIELSQRAAVTSVETTTSSFCSSKKRQFFQTDDLYAKYYRHCRNALQTTSSSSSYSSAYSSDSITVFGSAFSPLSKRCNSNGVIVSGDTRYFVACASNGCIYVWDVFKAFVNFNPDEDDHRHYLGQDYLVYPGSGIRSELKPILCVPVSTMKDHTRIYNNSDNNRTIIQNRIDSNNTLYDLKFVNLHDDDDVLLIVSGDPGVLVYKWTDFERAIIEQQQQTILHQNQKALQELDSSFTKPSTQTSDKAYAITVIHPKASFHPHPSPANLFGETIEINSTAFHSYKNVLYGASGDEFGCYQWDLVTEQLLGTFGGRSRCNSHGTRYCGHEDYLHVVKTFSENEEGEIDSGSRCVITGGEDGKMGFWDASTRKLIEMLNIRQTMDEGKNVVAGCSSTRNNASSVWNNGTKLYVSSMESNGSWLSVCGGAENGNTGVTGRSSFSETSASGFMTTWHLPTRTFTSGCLTRESVNTILYYPSFNCLVSGGNEGQISYWDLTTNTRIGRSWCTPPTTYALAISPDSSLMVAGGYGGVLDCFVDHVKVSQLQLEPI